MCISEETNDSSRTLGTITVEVTEAEAAEVVLAAARDKEATHGKTCLTSMPRPCS
jgi:hypothetical protein